jgi:DtxR family Mn-dependent transcriptional regulator
MNSFTEENYLKAIYHLTGNGGGNVTTNALAGHLQTTPAAVTDMLRKLSEKRLIHYEKYKGVSLTPDGNKIALSVIRKHRLWELFLVERLNFAWDQVHDIAEQLEHIRSDQLVEKLDTFLGHPRYDPHGDPIPDKEGRFHERDTQPLASLAVGGSGILSGVTDHSAGFLRHLQQFGLRIGATVRLVQRFPYDGSCEIEIDGVPGVRHLSQEAAGHLRVTLHPTP